LKLEREKEGREGKSKGGSRRKKRFGANSRRLFSCFLRLSLRPQFPKEAFLLLRK